MFTAQPFTTVVINSNRKLFRYCWYWLKNNVTGFAFSKYQPMRKAEDICVFYKSSPTYNPQGLIKLEKPIQKTRVAYDDCMGSGTTGVACVTTGREFIVFELEPIYFARALKRIDKAQER